MKILHKIERIIYNIELTAIVILLMSLIVFAFIQVIMRNFFDSSSLWMATYNNVALLLLALLGASVATSSFERSHINIDLFQGILKFPYNIWLSSLLSLIAGVACLSFFFFSGHYMMVAKGVGKMVRDINTPEWVIVLIFPVCFLSMSYKFFICFLNDLNEIKRKRGQ